MEYTDLFPYVALLQPNSLLTPWLNQDLFFLTLVDHKQFISYSLENFVDFSFQQPQGYHTPSLVRIDSYSTMWCHLNIKFVLGVPQGVACIALSPWNVRMQAAVFCNFCSFSCKVTLEGYTSFSITCWGTT